MNSRFSFERKHFLAKKHFFLNVYFASWGFSLWEQRAGEWVPPQAVCGRPGHSATDPVHYQSYYYFSSLWPNLSVVLDTCVCLDLGPSLACWTTQPTRLLFAVLQAVRQSTVRPLGWWASRGLQCQRGGPVFQHQDQEKTHTHTSSLSLCLWINVMFELTSGPAFSSLIFKWQTQNSTPMEFILFSRCSVLKTKS